MFKATSAVTHFMAFNGIQVCAYLDDFAGVSPPSTANKDFLFLGEMLSNLGLEEATSKSIEPSTRMEFLGIVFDSVKMTIEVSISRVQEINNLLQTWYIKRSASKRDLQSLIGKLQFVAKCVVPGRLFISRILDLLRGLKQPQHRRRLTAEFRKDIGWWLKFLSHFNGVSIMLDQQWLSPDSVVSTDACLKGGGGWLEGEFFSTEFPSWLLALDWHINSLELLTLLLALRLWCPLFRGKKILIYCDNSASVIVLNSGRGKDKTMLMLLREIALLCAENECMIKAVHLPGVDNRLADRLSRRSTMAESGVEALGKELEGWTERTITTNMFTCKNKW